MPAADGSDMVRPQMDTQIQIGPTGKKMLPLTVVVGAGQQK
ncbi:hypothetical protein ACGF0D_33080 [Kitasatospora sp. NPDC048298]